ncbi:hypothetical protein [Bacillus haynesii]|uniref:hypothetical protein n=1 Tax=Bacillus haynesii TaxID=1925021 RepID=UPI002281A503|nr:hypothetical protein [Bacillus haynesii]MCY7860554.1 hypothetical protein [Bacillus haynesii]MCY8342683.1 hypothetical protein [Bacillus haynesii]MCY9153243.1 hypothetical protein [Bacillus haynesii]MCY9263901.1 hypothetical protein [Bacillus haynesii]
MKKFCVKGLILSTVAGVSIFTFTPFAEAHASKALVKEQSYSFSSVKSAIDQTKEPTIDEIAQHWNLNKEETAIFKKVIKESQSEKNGDFTVQGKFTWAIKALKEAFDELPTKVKVAIGGVTGLDTILRTLEHYTGALEHGIYLGALKVTGNETAAWWVAKTLMLFV